MDHIETEFLKIQGIKPWFWKRFIDDIFSYGQKVKSLEKVLEDPNKCHPKLSLLMKNPMRTSIF